MIQRVCPTPIITHTPPTHHRICARRRSTVYATRGMVACSQPLAAEAGLRILQAGGNAADAAVAVAAALNVTEPTSTGGVGGRSPRPAGILCLNA